MEKFCVSTGKNTDELSLVEGLVCKLLHMGWFDRDNRRGEEAPSMRDYRYLCVDFEEQAFHRAKEMSSYPFISRSHMQSKIDKANSLENRVTRLEKTVFKKEPDYCKPGALIAIPDGCMESVSELVRVIHKLKEENDELRCENESHCKRVRALEERIKRIRKLIKEIECYSQDYC